MPCSSAFGDIYFSQENGLEESRYVFIDSQSLIERWQSLAAGETFTIAETGFGTGLNFLLCWHLWLKHAPKEANLQFISCEAYPLRRADLQRALSVWPELSSCVEPFIQHYPSLTPGFHWLEFEKGRVRLLLIFDDVLDAYRQLSLAGNAKLERRLRQQQVNAWFLDGFAPAKNESMWQEKLFFLMSSLSTDNTTVASFTAAGQVRKALESAGFSVQKKKGYGRKRHMITAVMQTQEGKSLRAIQKTPWYLGERKSYSDKSALIIGAGLAGCFMARRLAENGWKVKLIDKLPEAGMQASGNPRAVLFPKLSAFQSPLSELMLSSYLYSKRFFNRQDAIIRQADCLLLADSDKEEMAQHEMKHWLEHCPELAFFVDKKEASHQAGIALNYGGLMFPDSVYLDSKAYCQQLIQHPEIQFFANQVIDELEYRDGRWSAASHQASIAIIASGWEAKKIKACAHLPLKPLSGQMTAIKSESPLNGLQLVLCGTGHLLPADQDVQWTGTSYHPNLQDSTIKAEDDHQNIDKLSHFIHELPAEQLSVEQSWAGVRGSSSDYLPMVGEICKPQCFFEQYDIFRKNANAWRAEAAPAIDGLYLFSGFGSKGLTTIPLLSLHLLQLIEGQFSPLPTRLIQAVTPSRFLYRDLCRQG